MNIANVLNNIISKDIAQVEGKKVKQKYLTKAIKIATQTLKRKYKLPFEIKFHNGRDIDLELPVMKHFRHTSRPHPYNKRIVLYYNIPEWKKKRGFSNYQMYYNDKHGSFGLFEIRMNSIYEYIINNIHQLIITKRYMNENFSYKIPFDDDDRYTFYYSIVNKILVIQLLSVDINYMDTPKIHQEIIDLTTIDFNYYGNFLIYLLNQLNSTFTIKLKNHSKNGLPLAYLLLTETVDKKDLHIDWGYTFKDARGTGYSTVLRKLIQIYAYDKNINFVSTEAVAFGSQRGAKSAGMFQMPEIKVKPKLQHIPNNKKVEMFQPNNASFKSLRDAALRKGVYTQTSLLPRRQKNIINKHRGGLALNYFENNPVFGTHIRKIKGRENIAKNMTSRHGKHSLYK